MDFADLRQWFFDIVGILVPGLSGTVVAVAFALEPKNFGTQFINAEAFATALQPFSSQILNASLLFAAAFISGHLIQQISVYLLQFYERFDKMPRADLTKEVFNSREVRQYLMPQESALKTSGVSLNHRDYFMMVYPDVATKTKRETFISICGFSGAMAVVTLVTVALLGVSSLLSLWLGLGFSFLRILVMVPVGLLITKIWIERSIHFHDMADRVVVNYFLSKLGAYFRQRDAAPRS